MVDYKNGDGPASGCVHRKVASVSRYTPTPVQWIQMKYRERCLSFFHSDQLRLQVPVLLNSLFFSNPVLVLASFLNRLVLGSKGAESQTLVRSGSLCFWESISTLTPNWLLYFQSPPFLSRFFCTHLIVERLLRSADFEFRPRESPFRVFSHTRWLCTHTRDDQTIFCSLELTFRLVQALLSLFLC